MPPAPMTRSMTYRSASADVRRSRDSGMDREDAGMAAASPCRGYAQPPSFALKNAIVFGHACCAAVALAGEPSCPRKKPCPAPSKTTYSYALLSFFIVESVAGTVDVMRASLPPYRPSTGALIAAICSAVGGDP